MAQQVTIEQTLFVPSTGVTFDNVVLGFADDTAPSGSADTMTVVVGQASTVITNMWPAAIVQIEYSVDIASDASIGIDVIRLEARAVNNDASTIVNQPELDVASESTSIASPLDLYVDVSSSSSKAIAGDINTPTQFNITIGNRGPSHATNVVFNVRYQLPDGTSRIAHPIKFQGSSCNSYCLFEIYNNDYSLLCVL
jgi:hypothetical protein